MADVKGTVSYFDPYTMATHCQTQLVIRCDTRTVRDIKEGDKVRITKDTIEGSIYVPPAVREFNGMLASISEEKYHIDAYRSHVPATRTTYQITTDGSCPWPGITLVGKRVRVIIEDAETAEEWTDRMVARYGIPLLPNHQEDTGSMAEFIEADMLRYCKETGDEMHLAEAAEASMLAGEDSEREPCPCGCGLMCPKGCGHSPVQKAFTKLVAITDSEHEPCPCGCGAMIPKGFGGSPADPDDIPEPGGMSTNQLKKLREVVARNPDVRDDPVAYGFAPRAEPEPEPKTTSWRDLPALL